MHTYVAIGGNGRNAIPEVTVMIVGEPRLHRDKPPVDEVIPVVYHPDRGSESDEKMRVLASLAQDLRTARSDAPQIP